MGILTSGLAGGGGGGGGSSGGLIFISEATCSGNTQVDIEFTGDYDVYKIFVAGCSWSSAGLDTMDVRLGTDESTFISSSNSYDTSLTSQTTKMENVARLLGASSPSSFSELTVYDPLNSASRTLIWTRTAYSQAIASTDGQSGVRNADEAHTHIRFLTGTGQTMDGGTIRLYGVVNS